MRLLADEGVDLPVVERLRRNGHEVSYVAEMAPGLSDDAVLELARRDGRVLLTADRDFGDLVFRQRKLAGGVVLIRLAGLSAEKKADTVAVAVDTHAAELAAGFWVITPGAVRGRRSGSSRPPDRG